MRRTKEIRTFVNREEANVISKSEFWLKNKNI